MLIWWIVGNLGLVEVDASTLAVPDRLVLLKVLVEEPVNRDVVAVDDEPVLRSIDGPLRASAVIGTPQPGMVDDDIITVDLETGVSPAGQRAANATENVV